jgi:hypothetical protein
MHLKVALHVHTTCSDGDLSIPDVLDVYTARGFDAVALTDHDHLLRPGCYDQVDSVHTELIVFKGIELTVFEKGYVHVGRIDGDQEQLHIFNHPSELELPRDKVLERIAQVAQRLPLDAVEITSKGFATPEWDLAELPYPKVATDDSHTRLMCGRAWIELDCPRIKDAIIRAVKAGEFWNCFQA